MLISNPSISKTVTKTENYQLGKFLRVLSSLQKCLFEISTTHSEKVENTNFRIFQLKFEFFRDLSSLELNFLVFFFVKSRKSANLMKFCQNLRSLI